MSFLIHLKQVLTNNFKSVGFFYIIFYIVGILGMTFTSTQSLFIKLIPFSLLLSFIGLMLFHEEKWDSKTLVIFFTIYFSGFIIESIGTNTGFIFGEYSYGKSLGIMIFRTPLIIGINWLLLVYVSSSIVNRYISNDYLKFLLPPVLMVIYDLVMEQVANDLDMWSWKNNEIPIQNYFAWFILAFIFNFAVQKFRINTKNKLALTLFILQFLFFLILWVLK